MGYVRVKAVFYNANDYVKYLRRELGLGDVRGLRLKLLSTQELHSQLYLRMLSRS